VAIRNFIFISPRPQLVGVSPASIAGRWRVLAERSSRCTRWVGTGKPLDTLGILSLDQDDGGLDQNESAALLSVADAILRHNPELLTWIYSTIFTAGEGERDKVEQPSTWVEQASGADGTGAKGAISIAGAIAYRALKQFAPGVFISISNSARAGSCSLPYRTRSNSAS
jgi:hypothetical protein